MTKTAFEQIKAGLDEAAIVAPYLAEIERLTRERDEQKETAEYLLKLEQEWINCNNQLAEDWKKEHARADAAERKVEKLREALTPFAACVSRDGMCVVVDFKLASRSDFINARAALKEADDA